MSKTHIFKLRTSLISDELITEEKIEIIEECLNYVDVNYNDSELLIVAVCENNLEIVKFLVDKGINIQARNNEALIRSCRFDTDITEYLLKLGANVKANNNKAIWNAFSTNRNIKIKRLLLTYGADPNTIHSEEYDEKDKEWYSEGYIDKHTDASLFELVVYHGKSDDLKLLLEFGGNININIDRIIKAIKTHKEDPMYMYDIVRHFIDSGLNIDNASKKKLMDKQLN